MTTADRHERIRGHLATLMNECRPEWDVAGCVAALRNVPDGLPLVEVAIAALRLCADESNRTPSVLADTRNRAWDSDAFPPCPKHPTVRTYRRNGECGACFADRMAADILRRTDVQPVAPPSAWAEARRAIERRPA